MFKKKDFLEIIKQNKDNLGVDKIINKERYYYEMKEYEKFMLNIKSNYEFSYSIEYISFFIDILKKDIKYNALLEILKDNAPEIYKYPFYSMSRILNNDSTRIDIDISKTTLVSTPFKHSRYKSALENLTRKKFEYDRNNHRAIYYTDIDIALVYNGFHSLGVGSYLEKGIIEVDCYDMKRIYPYIVANSDLSFSYDKKAVENYYIEQGYELNDNLYRELNKRYYGTDYKLILLYQLCKYRNELKTKIFEK